MLDGQKVDPIGVGGARTVRHGLGGARSAMLYRLAEPPTALDLIAIANALTRGAIETPAIGDVTLFGDRQLYIELVCPVDLLVVTVGSGLKESVAAVDFAPLDQFEDDFDG